MRDLDDKDLAKIINKYWMERGRFANARVIRKWVPVTWTTRRNFVKDPLTGALNLVRYPVKLEKPQYVECDMIESDVKADWDPFKYSDSP